jgi:hypothetical protein
MKVFGKLAYDVFLRMNGSVKMSLMPLDKVKQNAKTSNTSEP